MDKDNWASWDEQRLDYEYSPSKWSKRGSGEWVFENHVSLVTKVSEEVRNSIPCQLSVPYGEREGEKFDVFGADDLPPNSPVFVYIHGGYWQLLDRTISAYCVRPLHQAGNVTVIVGYDLTPKVEFHEIIQEIKSAISHILKWAAKRGSQCVVIGGHSAGAHLAAMLLYGDDAWAEKEANFDLIRGLVLISGVFDLRPISRISSLNEPLKLDSSKAEKYSPLLNLANLDEKSISDKLKRVRHVLVVAENDPNEFKRQTAAYAQALKTAGFDVSSEVIPMLDHFDIVEKLREEDYHLTHVVNGKGRKPYYTGSVKVRLV